MCGITGFWDTTASLNENELTRIVNGMSDTIVHRGPDDSGAWVDEQCGIALGFRRLAILDLSPTGHQPMSSADGQYKIIFNGEIYNFYVLRKELEEMGIRFRGTSDTEIILEAIGKWGLEATVQRLNGMFAFALWDRSARKLHLVRDRIGIKPMYYGWNGSTFYFGSELKTLRAHPAFNAEVDRQALTAYLRYTNVPAPYSIYEGIYKLPPASILTLDGKPGEARPRTYWSVKDVVIQGLGNPYRGSDEEAVDELDALLRLSIKERMISDVPLGAFLSGGVDSSTIVALMQAQSDRPVQTFTIGFHEKGYNEAVYAKAVARYLGTDHTELYLTPEETRSVIPLLPGLYDEPFADSSQIPTYLVSKLAREKVTVSLSGDGGDELFGGYNRYQWAPRLWNLTGWMPGGVRRAAAGVLGAVPPGLLGRLGGSGPLARIPQFVDKARKVQDILPLGSPEEIYHHLVSIWGNPTDVVLGGSEAPIELTDPALRAAAPNLADWMMFMDLITYVPNDIMVKVDRASMGVSLESRPPLLDDHRLIEFAWRLPLSMKVRDGKSKWLLRQVLYRYVPREMIERPKQGFSVPIGAWLRGPLRPWAEALLDENKLRRQGYFNPEPIRRKWAEHVSGKANWQYPLWAVLMFQAWLER